MEILKNKKVLALIVAVVVIVAAIVVLMMTGKNPITPGTGPGTGGSNQQPTSDTRGAVPSDIKVPGLGDTTGDNNIAVPVGVTDAAPGVSAQLRSFNIKAEGGVFNPSTVIVNVGDTVHINFTAVDKEYDMVLPDYGMKQTAKKGETKIFEFQAVSTGKFTYYCESCGGLSSQAKGFIIIAEK